MTLIEDSVARRLHEAKKAGLQPSEEQMRAFEARADSRRSDGPASLVVAGDTAQIRVEGILTKKPDVFAFLFGGGNTAYEDLQEAFEFALRSDEIERVQMFVDSPGGDVDGYFEALASLEALALQKPIEVQADNALSAAYGLAALAGPIEATNVGAAFGSVGVAASFLVLEEIVTLTNSESPRKRPDLSTEEGRQMIVEHLDAIAELLIDAVARGRGTTVEDVTQNFGRGATLFAGDARQRGMIDSIAAPRLAAVPGGRSARAAAESPAGPTTSRPGAEVSAVPVSAAEVPWSRPDPEPQPAAGGASTGAGDETHPGDPGQALQSAPAAGGGPEAGAPELPTSRVEPARARGVSDLPDLTALRPVPDRVQMPEGSLATATHVSGNDAHRHGGGASSEKGKGTMEELTEEQLRAQHPQLHEAVLQRGREQGIRGERDRVEAHLTLGVQSGDLETAHTAIRDGSEMTQALQAKYMAAGMARSDREIRQRETDEAGAAADGAKPAPEDEPAVVEQVADLFAEKMGAKPKEVSHG